MRPRNLIETSSKPHRNLIESSSKAHRREDIMRAIHHRRALFALAATLAFGAAAASPAPAQDYPNRKLTFMVGFAPGGGIDTIARVIAQGLTEQFGYQIVIENR